MFDLKRFRKERKINQKTLADQLGVGQPFVSQIESGKDPMPDALIEKLADIYQVNNISDYFKEEITDDSFRNENEDVYFVPLLPISAQGGSLNDFIVSVKGSDCERVVSPIKGADFAITVSGDSMAPEYPNGAQILIKRINEKAFIDWGKTYVLDTCNGTVIKTLVPSDNEGFVKCLSINNDPKYATFEVSFEDIYGVYRVMMCMSVK
ncbi:hypothetical protein FACS189451_09260 [Bacteroidia bacterium]|nr:hypothetical protein FACS189451_09260 [Bacteroidia bacterium]